MAYFDFLVLYVLFENIITFGQKIHGHCLEIAQMAINRQIWSPLNTAGKDEEVDNKTPVKLQPWLPGQVTLRYGASSWGQCDRQALRPRITTASTSETNQNPEL